MLLFEVAPIYLIALEAFTNCTTCVNVPLLDPNNAHTASD